MPAGSKRYFRWYKKFYYGLTSPKDCFPPGQPKTVVTNANTNSSSIAMSSVYQLLLNFGKGVFDCHFDLPLRF